MKKIKIQNQFYEIKNIIENPPLLTIIFNEKIDLTDKDLSLIEVYTEGGMKCREFTEYETIYKPIDNNCKIILSSDGSIYTELEDNVPVIIEPYEPTPEELASQLLNLKKSKIELSKILLEKYLLEHPLLYKDGFYYSVTLEKQNLLAGQLMAYQLELQKGVENPILEWNSVGEECIPWTYDDLSDLAIAIKAYVKPYVAYQRAIEKQINASVSIEEVNNMVINYDEAI